MKDFRLKCAFVFSVLCYFALMTIGNSYQQRAIGLTDRVVISPPLQVVLAFGDPYLAANFEVIRLAATGMELNATTGTVDGKYLLRAHRAATQLNPCHEDNYYLANAILGWGGADQEANDILWSAAQCRHWDFLPAFLYGFNQYFFNRNVAEAQRGLELAAERDPGSASAINRFSIMIKAEELDDEAMALAYLKEQQSQASDPRLAASLQDRVVRLEGLIQLREAQATYESRFGKPLPSAQALLDSGLLESFPTDPLGIGYEFVDDRMKLRQLRIQGVERPQ